MTRYAFFDGNLREGGAERVISILANEMCMLNENIVIITFFEDEIFYKINEKIKVIAIESYTQSRSILKNLLWLRKYLNENVDILISFLAPFNMMAILATRFTRIKVIVADRNDPRYVPRRCFLRCIRNFLYNYADGIVLQTKLNYEYFNKNIREKSTIIYNPVEVGKYSGKAINTKKEKKIVSVGRLIEQKNHTLLIRAFAKFHEDYPDYKLVIFGEGNKREMLTALIRELKIDKYVSLPGNSKQIFDEMLSAEMFVLTSIYEGMPNVLIEAMALGLPVISTRVSGATDLIIDGLNGILVDVNEEEELLKALKRMCIDKNMRLNLGKNAQNISVELAPESIAGKWISFISSVVN